MLNGDTQRQAVDTRTKEGKEAGELEERRGGGWERREGEWEDGRGLLLAGGDEGGEGVHGEAGLAGEAGGGGAEGDDEEAPLLAEGEIAGGGFVAGWHRCVGDEDEAASGGFGLGADGFFGRGDERGNEHSAVGGGVEP